MAIKKKNCNACSIFIHLQLRIKMKLPYTLLFLTELSPKIYFSYFPLDTTITTDISNLLISNTNKTKKNNSNKNQFRKPLPS